MSKIFNRVRKDVRVRRCSTVMIEAKERLAVSLQELVQGKSGILISTEWTAYIPHLDREIILDPVEIAALQRIPSSEWSEGHFLESTVDPSILNALVEKGVLVVEGDEAESRDDKLKRKNWFSISAVLHQKSRWRGIDTAEADEDSPDLSEMEILKSMGKIPPTVKERTTSENRIRLPERNPSTLDSLLDRRVTCRNFDTDAHLGKEEFSDVLQRVFGARSVMEYLPGLEIQKKAVPSAGGLHPTEIYLLVQRVQDVAPGLYHYHPIEHALEPMRRFDAGEGKELATRCVAGQRYFADAHVLVVQVSRFERNFWKYRNHAKAYRALILDIGHLSQTLYLAATELGLGAFVTAAVNEVDIEDIFELDALEESPLAVNGFGIRAPKRTEIELDPLGMIWPR